MSQDFSQYDQQQQEYGNQPPVAQRQGGGCRRGCFIGLIVIGVLLAVLIGLFVWIVKEVAEGITQDPQEISKRLLQQFPAAKVPEDYEGKVGIRVDFIVKYHRLVFGKDETVVSEDGRVEHGDAIVLFTFDMPGMREEDMEDAVMAANEGDKVMEKREHRVQAGEYVFDGFMQKVQGRRGGGGPKFSMQLLVPLGNGMVLIMQGGRDKVDEVALASFLASIAKDCPSARKADAKEKVREGAKEDEQRK